MKRGTREKGMIELRKNKKKRRKRKSEDILKEGIMDRRRK